MAGSIVYLDEVGVRAGEEALHNGVRRAGRVRVDQGRDLRLPDRDLERPVERDRDGLFTGQADDIESRKRLAIRDFARVENGEACPGSVFGDEVALAGAGLGDRAIAPDLGGAAGRREVDQEGDCAKGSAVPKDPGAAKRPRSCEDLK